MKTEPIIKNFLTRAAMTLGERISRPFTMMLLMLMTAATAWATLPDRCLDACTGGAGFIHVEGWAYDPDAPEQSLDVHVYVYTNEKCTAKYGGICKITANVFRPDVNDARNITGDHGFSVDIPIYDVGSYWVKVYAFDTGGDGNPQIGSTTAVTVSSGSFTIGSVAEWNAFANNVSNRKMYNGMTVKLIADIGTAQEPVTAIVGVSGFPFSGTFDGDGKKLYVSISGSGARAPFGNINGAKIKNLTVEGNVTGDNHSAGLVAACGTGTNTISGCTVLTNVSGAAYMGGIVGHGGDGTLTIKDCVYGGIVSGFTGYAGGLLGWCDALTLKINNCLMKGAMTAGSGGKYHPIACKNGGSTVTSNVRNTYYLYTLPATTSGENVIPGAEGTPVIANETEDYFIPVTAADGLTYYLYLPATTVTSSTIEWTNGLYVVTNDVTASDHITVSGTVTLILCEGVTLNARYGIGIESGNTLIIEGSGTLQAREGVHFRAAIGGTSNSPFGHIIINSGTVIANGGPFSAGIGGGLQNKANNNSIVEINGGVVTATGGQNGAGIGSGERGKTGVIIINGGQVTVRGGKNSAGIGKGDHSSDDSGSLTLGWTHESDFIDVDSYDIGSISFAEGQQFFIDGEGILATVDNIGGKRIVPIVANDLPSPTDLAVIDATDKKATLTWTAPETARTITGYTYQYKKEGESTWSDEVTTTATSVTISGLTERTNYIFLVKTLYGSNASVSASLSFATYLSLPYEQGFENGMDGWVKHCNWAYTGISESAKHSGEYGFEFVLEQRTQYLISPPLTGKTIVDVSFFVRTVDGNSETFRVAYSTTDESVLNYRTDLTIQGTNWHQYQGHFPEGTKYIAILYLKSNNSGLYIDDIVIKERPDDIALANNADNADVISEYEDKSVNVTLQGRTLYRDGDWNTLAVPFNVSSFAGTPLEGATVKTLSSTAFTDGTLTLNFEDATEIEAGKPYIVKWDEGVNLTINSMAEWNAFAESVNGGKSYAGKTVLLGADIDVSTMAGTAEHPFSGTFEGAGHTLNVSISGGGNGAAPFRYISGATIRNVKTTGSVNGGNYSAGLVGYALGGTNRIRDCYVTATVNTSGSYVGGTLGNGTTSTTTISNCMFSGYLTAANMGILYGWGEEGGTHTVENCVAYGTYADLSLIIDEGDGRSIDLLLGNGTKTVTNCYKNKDVGSQGDYWFIMHMGGTHPLISSYLGSQWTYDNGFVLSPTVSVVDENIVNPVFKGVTVSATAPLSVAFSGGQFTGTYSPLASTTGLLFDAHNPDNGACRAYLNIDVPNLSGFEGWYTDDALTTPVTTIPFDVNGTVKLYAKWILAGDVNGDGLVTITDAAVLMDYLKTGLEPAGFVKAAADVDGKPGITMSDAVAILEMILNGLP